jgi:hypothetical protein
MTETKAEKKFRKARVKAGLPDITDSTKRYVVCLKWGTKYGAEYVNKLNNMVARNLSIDYEFVCFTEDRKGIDPQIRIEPLPAIPVTGWWYKPWFLSNDVPLDGTILFLDLDLIVFKNIDNLFTYEPDKKFVIIRDFNRQIRKGWDRMNSSVFRVQKGAYDSVYKTFQSNTQAWTRRYQGDQDFMYSNIKDHKFWPDEWIQSYKWEMRGRDKLTVINGKRTFKDTAEPTLLPQTSIAVFHGQPNIPDCIDSWPTRNWF